MHHLIDFFKSKKQVLVFYEVHKFYMYTEILMPFKCLFTCIYIVAAIIPLKLNETLIIFDSVYRNAHIFIIRSIKQFLAREEKNEEEKTNTNDS